MTSLSMTLPSVLPGILGWRSFADFLTSICKPEGTREKVEIVRHSKNDEKRDEGIAI